MSALPPPSDYCTQVERTTFDGFEIRVGDRISFGYQEFIRGSDERKALRAVGAITELWEERHPNVRGPRIFAEVDCDDGIERRAWFLRDKPKPASELEAFVGAAPEDALF